jgi:hypothetical protein
MNDETREDFEATTVPGVSIDQPKDGSVIDAGDIHLSGKGVARVKIRIGGANWGILRYETYASESGGVWNYSLPHGIPPGLTSIYIESSIFFAEISFTSVFSPPVIAPQEGSNFNVRGTGVPFALVQVTEKVPNEPLVAGVATVDGNGTWFAKWVSGYEPQNRNYEFVARQSFSVKPLHNEISDFSAPQSYIVELPAPTITQPADGTEQNPTFTVTGEGGVSGATVEVLKNTTGHDVIATGSVKPGGGWDVPVTLPWGQTTVVAEQFIGGGKHSVRSAPRTFKINLTNVTITAPAPDSMQSQTFTVSGEGGISGATIEILKDLAAHDVIATGPVKVGGNWDVSVTLPPGRISLVAEQFIGAEHSTRSGPRAFRVRPPALAAITPTLPNETSVKFSGTGHTGATVEISIVSGPGGTAPSTVVVNAGKWETTATNWPFGTYSLRAIQKVPDNAGGWIESLPYTFTFSRVLPDLSDVTYTAVYQPTFSGKGYNGATVKLYDPGGSSMVAPDALVTGGRWSVVEPGVSGMGADGPSGSAYPANLERADVSLGHSSSHDRTTGTGC